MSEIERLTKFYKSSLYDIINFRSNRVTGSLESDQPSLRGGSVSVLHRPPTLRELNPSSSPFPTGVFDLRTNSFYCNKPSLIKSLIRRKSIISILNVKKRTY